MPGEALAVDIEAGARIGHFRAGNEATLLEFLVRRAGLTRDAAEWLLSFGAIYVDSRRAPADQPLTPGQYVRVHRDPKRFPVGDVDWLGTIVADEADFSVISKPPGVPVHATVDNRIENVISLLSEAVSTPLRVTQRLDHGAAGLLVLAKTAEFQSRFNRLLAAREVEKRYRALAATPVAAGRHVHYMKPDARGPKLVSGSNPGEWRECVLHVLEVRPLAASVFDMDIRLETGRTHQIQTQLSAMGSPILGDRLYGADTPFEVSGRPFPGIALFCAATSWTDADGGLRSYALAPPWGQY